MPGPTQEHADWLFNVLGVRIGQVSGAPLPDSAPAPGAPAPGGVLDRLRGGARSLADGARGLAADVAHGAEVVVQTGRRVVRQVGAATGLAPPIPRIGSGQQSRGEALISRMSPADQVKVRQTLDNAGSDDERTYLQRGIASGHSAAEIAAFGQRIRGKDLRWLQDNLSLTGDSHGRGVQQQWSHSCNATAAEAVRGQLDPLYALQMHDQNPHLGEAADDSDPNKVNPNLAAAQRTDLESTFHAPDGTTTVGGVAAARDDGAHGEGRWNSDLLNAQAASTGVRFTTRQLDGSDAQRDQAISDIDAAADQHLPTPIVIGNGAEEFTHYVVVTASDPGPPRQYTIHDPWSGETVTRSADQMRGGRLDIAGSNQVTAIEQPSAVAAH